MKRGALIPRAMPRRIRAGTSASLHTGAARRIPLVLKSTNRNPNPLEVRSARLIPGC
jgi:hypothetical protein